MYIPHGKSLIEHHTHYKEIHGYDKTILMTKGEHESLHNKLRKTKKCNIPVYELKCISQRAMKRTHKEESEKYEKQNIKYVYLFCYSFETNTKVQGRLKYNIKTDHIGISSSFSVNNKRRLHK